MRTASRTILFLWFLLGAAAAQEEEEEPETFRVGEKQLTALFHRIDKNKDGKVPAAEFHAFAKEMRHHMAHNPRTDNMTYFQELDTDEDGKVSFKESMPFADGNDESFMEHDKAKFKAADKDGNGFLDAKEFPAWEWPEIDVEVEEAFARSLFQE